MKRKATHISLGTARSMWPPEPGQLAASVFAHGTLEAEYYAPDRVDLQQPHTRDEIYVVASGSGRFFNGEERIAIDTGDFLFVPAGVEYRFEEFSDDFAVWVFFYGPEGGEAAR